MNFDIREKLDQFLNNSKDYPLLVGFLTGFYPLVFFYSNNYESINSWPHFGFFCFLFLFIPSTGTYFLYRLFSHFEKLNPYKKQLLFVLAIELTAIFLSQVYYLTIKKKLLLGLLIITIYLSLKFYNSYKKILVFIVLLSLFPLIKCINIIVYKGFNDTLGWTKQNDNIENINLVTKPNIYFIEPDGYAGKKAMFEYPYQYKDTLYDWLESNSFTLYKDTKSNYPGSLASNSSMFSMKQSYTKNQSSSSFKMQDARSIIGGNNPVIAILKNNNYKTYFIVENEYFLQNYKSKNYDYYNIKNSEIPFFTNDKVRKNVYEDLKKCFENDKQENQPKFYFIEKLTPHHIVFDGTGKANERKVYLEKIEEANSWLKKTIRLIEKKDPAGIIIIASDHGGWVGIENDGEMYATKNPKLLNSIFSNLIAIKWNEKKHLEYDAALKTNVNIFRVLFSCLSEDKTVLQHLEDDSSHNVDL